MHRTHVDIKVGFPFRSVPFRSGTFRSVPVGPAAPVLHPPHTPTASTCSMRFRITQISRKSRKNIRTDDPIFFWNCETPDLKTTQARASSSATTSRMTRRLPRWGSFFPRCKGVGEHDADRRAKHSSLKCLWRVRPANLNLNVANLNLNKCV